MKNLVVAFLAVLALGLIGCEKSVEGDLEMTFKARYGDDPLVMLNKYAYAPGQQILFQRFNFYISDVTLIKGDREEQLLDIDFVDFDPIDNLEDALAGVQLAVSDIPADKYTAIRIGLGVPAALNATSEADYSDSHPLGKDSHYWSAWGSYIFTMINAKVDTDADGLFDDVGVLYHTGADELYRTKTFTLPLEIIEDQTAQITFDIDLRELFLDEGGFIDVEMYPTTHDISDLSTATKVMDNFQRALLIVD